MRKELFAPLSKKTLSHIANLFESRIDTFQELAKRDNIVIEAEKGNHRIILRISHGSRRTPDQVEAEITWLNMLLAEEISVCSPIPSLRGRFVETIQNKDVVLSVVAFAKLPGKYPTKANWNDQLFEKWGELLGQMHALAKRYATSRPKLNRNEWYEEPNYDFEKLIPGQQKEFFNEADMLFQELQQLPLDASVYGLTHGDFHRENTHLHKEHLTAFDFDDLQYSWFVNDIAITLYYARWRCPKDQSMEAYVKVFMHAFLTGYRKEMEVSASLLGTIPKFLKLRHIFMYANHYRTWDFSRISDEQRMALDEHRKGIGRFPNLAIDFRLM